MTSVRRGSKRRRKPRRRLDLSAMKEAMRDDRLFPCLALVTEDDSGGSHFDLDGEDLLIECELQPNGERVSARMGAVGGGPGQGLWFIPPVGAEVMLLICDGEMEAGAVIVGVLSTGALPGGIAPDVTVLANASKVLIHDGSESGVDKLVFKTAYEAHVHPSGTGPTGTPDNAALPASYTAILEAK